MLLVIAYALHYCCCVFVNFRIDGFDHLQWWIIHNPMPDCLLCMCDSFFWWQMRLPAQQFDACNNILLYCCNFLYRNKWRWSDHQALPHHRPTSNSIYHLCGRKLKCSYFWCRSIDFALWFGAMTLLLDRDLNCNNNDRLTSTYTHRNYSCTRSMKRICE